MLARTVLTSSMRAGIRAVRPFHTSYIACGLGDTVKDAVKNTAKSAAEAARHPSESSSNSHTMSGSFGSSPSHSSTSSNKSSSSSSSSSSSPSGSGKDIDTSGTVSDWNSKFGGILGLAGAPVFTKGDNVCDLIDKDHKTVESMYKEYTSTKDKKKQQELAWTITKELVQHSEVEQLLVYPLLKMRNIDHGQETHDSNLKEHQNIRELLYALDQTSIDDPSHAAKLKAAFEAVAAHVKHEEKDMLPQLRKHFTEDELRKAGAAFSVHKYTAVTRPHPNAPMQGPAAAAVNMATKPIDLIRDAVRNVTEKK